MSREIVKGQLEAIQERVRAKLSEGLEQEKVAKQKKKKQPKKKVILTAVERFRKRPPTPNYLRSNIKAYQSSLDRNNDVVDLKQKILPILKPPSPRIRKKRRPKRKKKKITHHR